MSGSVAGARSSVGPCSARCADCAACLALATLLVSGADDRCEPDKPVTDPGRRAQRRSTRRPRATPAARPGHGPAVRDADEPSTPTSRSAAGPGRIGWRVRRRWPQVTFHLRPSLTFSDGTPAPASDVVRSWLRLIDPAHPSPLASLMIDVKGADAYLRGQSTDPASVGLQADDAAARHGRSRPSGDRLRRRRVRPDVRGRARPGSMRRGRPDARAGLRGQRRLRPDGARPTRSSTLTANTALLGRARRPIRTIHLRHRPRRQQPGRGVLGGRPRLHAGRDIDATWLALRPRRSARSSGAVAVAVVDVLRLRHDQAAVRRRPGPPGLRPGGRLAPDGRAGGDDGTR